MKLIKLSRDNSAIISKETVDIAKKGYYRVYTQNDHAPKQINIGSMVYNSVHNTILYAAGSKKYEFINFDSKKTKYQRFKNMDISIINETTLNGCYALSQDPNISNPVALNFASAKNPGISSANSMNFLEISSYDI